MMKFALIVTSDDEAFSRSREQLRSLRLSVEQARRGIEAYRRIVSLPTLDVVIVDVGLDASGSSSELAKFAKQVLPKAEVLLVE